LRSRLQRSIEYEPAQSAAYEMLAWVEAFSEEPSISNVNLIQRHFPTLRQQQRTLLALAFVRVRKKQPEDAKELLGQLDEMQPDPWTMHGAEVVRAKLENRPVRRVEPPRPKNQLPAVTQPLIDIPKK
jgi:hypothetical protein